MSPGPVKRMPTMSTRQFAQGSWKNKNVILGEGRPLETLQGVFRHIFRPMSDPPHIDVTQLSGQIGTQFILEMNIQRLGKLARPICYYDPMDMQPIVGRNVTNALLGSFR